MNEPCCPFSLDERVIIEADNQFNGEFGIIKVIDERSKKGKPYWVYHVQFPELGSTLYLFTEEDLSKMPNAVKFIMYE